MVFNKILSRFYNSNQQENDQTSEDENDNQKLYLEIPYVGKSSRKFFQNMSNSCLKIAGLKLVPLYKTMKVSKYFHLKFEFEFRFFKVNEFEFRFFKVNEFEFRFFNVNKFEYFD